MFESDARLIGELAALDPSLNRVPGVIAGPVGTGAFGLGRVSELRRHQNQRERQRYVRQR